MESSIKRHITEIRGAGLVEFVAVAEREVWKLKKADKWAKMDDESGGENSLVVVVSCADHAEVLN